MPELRVIQEYRALEQRILDAMTPALGDAEFSQIALEVFTFQCRWNAVYRAFAANAPEPRDWREIPAVPQAAFKRSQLSCVPADLVETVFRTSGTTGETRGEHHFLDTRLYDAAIVRGWDLLQPGAWPIRVIGRPAQDAPDSSLSHMFGVLVRESLHLADAYYFIDHEGFLDTDEFQRTSEIGRPVAVLGTALGFLNLFERLGQRRINLAPGSYVLETGGYKGSGRELAKRDLYEMFQEFLGVPARNIINEYGMTELSSQFYTRGLGQPHTAPPWLKALVIDPETGKEAAIGDVGILRIFDLANLNSVIAMETQDLAIRHDEGFELLGRDPAALPRGCSRAADQLLRQ